VVDLGDYSAFETKNDVDKNLKPDVDKNLKPDDENAFHPSIFQFEKSHFNNNDNSDSNNNNNNSRNEVGKKLMTICIDNKKGLLVLHPDTMISPTRIADSCSCMRRSVISEKIKSFGNASTAGALGNLKHSIVEVFFF
jgi:hypothetical protein